MRVCVRINGSGQCSSDSRTSSGLRIHRRRRVNAFFDELIARHSAARQRCLATPPPLTVGQACAPRQAVCRTEPRSGERADLDGAHGRGGGDAELGIVDEVAQGRDGPPVADLADLGELAEQGYQERAHVMVKAA